MLDGVYFGPKVRITFQPPDSPDLNVLDLGFFTKFWTKIHKLLPKSGKIPSLDELWEVCQQAWELITPVEIEILFQTQKARMRQVVECNGRNDMPMPHEGIRERVLAEDALLKNIIPE